MTLLKTIGSALTFLALTWSSGTLYAQECAPFDDFTLAGNIADEAIDEASGLAASWRHEDLLWTHNDSGGGARLFLMTSDGSAVATVHLAGVDEATDWEDVAVGPCREGSDESCVYIADIGDNRAKRERVVIHRFEEPEVPDDAPADITVRPTSRVWFQYPDGPRDAEALMVHPQTGQVYVVQKNARGGSGVYRIPRRADGKTSREEPAEAVKVGELRISSPLGFGAMITAGDISPSGREFSVRTYLGVYTYCADDGDGIEAALEATPVRSNPPFMIQSEALGYDRSADSVWVTSERRPAPVYRLDRGERDESDEPSEDK